MPPSLVVIAAFVLFLLSVRLSAFFSGAETGFYRVSFLRLSIDAQAGDRVADRLMWFARNPGYFVATVLVGNNVANYLTTMAVGVATVALDRGGAGWVEIVGTLLVSPVVFIFGELVPKNLYYRSPLSLLRRDSLWIVFFFRLFLIVSFPLIWITKLVERFSGGKNRALERVLGRTRLVQVLSRGHEEGLLLDVQSRLVHGLMLTAAEPVTESMTPSSRVLGIADDASRDEVLEHARSYGLTNVVVKRANSEADWYGYIRVVDAAATRKPLASLIRPMPKIESHLNKLQAMLVLRKAGAAHGVVCRDEQVLGIVNERGLVEQLFRPPQPFSARFPSPR